MLVQVSKSSSNGFPVVLVVLKDCLYVWLTLLGLQVQFLAAVTSVSVGKELVVIACYRLEVMGSDRHIAFNCNYRAKPKLLKIYM